jgi:predicted Rdx family selenoprotein
MPVKNEIVIRYCAEGGLLDAAASLAARIQQATGIKTILKEGHAGILEVTCDQKIVYSNQAQVRMDGTPEAIISHLLEILS